MDSEDTPHQVAAGTEGNFIHPIPPPARPDLPTPVLSIPITYDRGMTDFPITRHTQSQSRPEFRIVTGDPVKVALSNAAADSMKSVAIGGERIRVPFICAVSRKGPGSRHRDVRPTYEEDFYHRSNLFYTLIQPRLGMNALAMPHYPVSDTAAVFCDSVAVNYGPREDNYEKLDPTPNLPVVLVSPVLRPKVTGNDTAFSDVEDKVCMREKICSALRICLHHEYDRVVIGDFGLGDWHRNPPQAVAEIWRDLLLFHPDLCGQFKCVVFAFVDPMQSTTQLFRDRKQKINEERRARQAAKEGTSSISTRRTLSSQPAPTDMAIFESLFDEKEIERVVEQAALVNRHLLSWET
ncbi:hypothetical protein E4U27_000733 [Claviceps purpurea]|nr:hypothetical protein E4U27_000733 [Claviceps purpurea]KAG6234212.1 hypothetical protein E4U26_005949 [Claviceps purpurea]KAG6325677.1 hypothetical protein E4U44_000083 [Claviceps purpurea]